MKSVEIILYVSNQNRSKEFYEKLLRVKPSLDVPGMTEFELSDSVKLGLMPESGIKKILSDKTPDPAAGNGIPRCELYLKVDDAEEFLKRGISLGAKEISKLQNRDWGEKAGYISDYDGHIIAFAENI